MFTRIIDCLKRHGSARKGLLGFLIALLILGILQSQPQDVWAISPRPRFPPARNDSAAIDKLKFVGQQSPAQRNSQEITTLEQGKRVERDLSGEQKHVYQITLAEGQYARVMVEQRGIDLVVQILGADGKSKADFDSEIRTQGEERIEVVADSAGSYQLLVRASSKSAPTGSYRICVTEIRVASKNDRSLAEARQLEERAKQALSAGKYEDVRQLTERAIAISADALGTEDPFVARLESELAYYHFKKRNFAQAASLLEGALIISERSLGSEHAQTIDITRALGILNVWANERAKAEPLLQRAVDTSQKTLGSGHYLVAKCLRDLAWVTRDRKRQEELLQRALEIAEKTVGPEHEIVAEVVDRLGVLSARDRDYQKAERLLLRAQAIYQKTLGPENLHHGDSFFSLAFLAHRQGQFAKAEGYYLKAIEGTDRVLGPDNFESAAVLNNLAVIYHSQADYAKSLEAHLRVLRVAEKTRGQYDRLIVTSLGGISISYAALRNVAEAVRYRALFEAAVESETELNLAIGSEREKLAYMEGAGNETSRTISFNVNLAPNVTDATGLSALVLLQRKGRLLDAMSDSFASLRQRSTPEEQALIEQYNETTARFASLVLSGPRKATPEEHQKAVRQLEEQKGRLEAEISRRSAEFRAAKQPVTLAAVQAAIPGNAALIEFAVYRPYDPVLGAASKAYGEPRYIGYVLRQSGEVRWHDLGNAKAIDEHIGSLRQALSNPLSREVRERARVLDGMVMQPIREVLGNANQLLISPDGPLNLIPFEALIDEDGRYLVQRYSFAYLTSGRDLLRLQVRRESKSPPVVVADPAFGEPAVIAPRVEAARGADAGERIQLDYSQVFFGPLPGVGDEVRALKQLLPKATFLTKEQATKAALKRVNGPSILHIATHGFFLQNDPLSSKQPTTQTPTQTTDQTRLGKWVAWVENPQLRSGLALAGANQAGSGNDNGVLTAFEASGLDLWGTKLVVLSACDTGVGEVKNGEGVYGLRRALVLAGSESQMMSLWAVSDRSTRDLIVGYYTALLHGAGRSEALRQVQLRMLHDKSRAHPYYWAGFILSGQWAKL